MNDILSHKQIKFLIESTAKWNMAHGSVRTGKTIITLLRFMQAVDQCRDSDIYLVGFSATTAYENVVKLLFDNSLFCFLRPFITWSPGNKILTYKDKKIKVYGAGDEGTMGTFQGKTMSLVYCDEITLYPISVIEMIDSRLSNPWSMGFASMNPTHPEHLVKKWIDAGIAGDKNYYSLHFVLDDNPYVDDDYKNRLKNNRTGLFYKRNYLGLWCLAEGAIFDFFDRDVHVVKRPPAAADYYIAGIDYGISNAFACLLIGVYTGVRDQRGRKLWVESEYYWDSRAMGRQKLNSELAADVCDFLEPYGIRSVYIDPSAASMKLELRRKSLPVIDADNDVYNGIEKMVDEMSKGNLFVMDNCRNLIKEIQTYVWDEKKARQGYDEPVKKSDHAVDALRYAIYTHKVTAYQPYKHNPNEFMANKYNVTRSI